jgi:hypothetical protein
MGGRFPGKVVIFPQISGLPLIGVAELRDKYPDVAAKLGSRDVWTREAERALIERFWRP